MSARIYERKFDWDEARRLRSQGGLNWSEIARRMGVTPAAVRRACNEDERRRDNERSAAWTRGGQCPDCGAQTTRHYAGQVRRCQHCNGLAHVKNVRARTLKCNICKRWLSDERFPWNRHPRSAVRRYRHQVCRDCQAEMRQRSRERRKVPCVNCGKPRTHPNDNGAGIGRKDTGLCLTCWRARKQVA